MKKTKQTVSFLEAGFKSIAHPVNADVYQNNPEAWADALGSVSKLATAYFTNPQSVDVQNINHALMGVLENGITADPSVLNQNTIDLDVLGANTTFKVETAAKFSTLDAINIQWDKQGQQYKMEKAWEINKTNYKDRSTLLVEHLKDLPGYEDLSLGVVTSFDRVIERTGKSKDETIETQQVTGAFPVVGYSKPVIGDGERQEPRPAVKLDVKDHPIIKELPVALVARPNLSKRGLFGEYDIIKNGLSIVMDGRSTAIVDFHKVDPVAVSNALKPFVS